MAIYAPPINDRDRVLTMETAISQATTDTANAFISPKTLNKAQELLPKMKEAMIILARNKAIRAGDVAEKDVILVKVDKYVRHLWAGLINRVDREDLPVSVLKYYQLPLSGIMPKTYPRPSIITTAKSIVTGDAQAVEAGYAPMANPSAEELAAMIEIAEKEISDVSVADKAVDENEATLKEMRAEADQIIRKIVADLRYFLMDEDEPSQRRIMRRYGLVFRSEQEGAEE